MMPTLSNDTDSLGSNILSVALIGPEERRRRSIAGALSEIQGSVTKSFSSYPELDDLPQLLKSGYDVVIVDLDNNTEHALDLVENIHGNSAITVMVYSEKVDSELLVRCMRAGAREFLTQPVSQSTIAEAMVRASVRRRGNHASKKTAGKLLVFVGAKGGSGVTTLASNFAVAVAQESAQSTALIDVNLPLGDAALELGLTAPHSVASALENIKRLDANYLSTVMVKHSSGLSVLAGPDKYSSVQPSNESVEKLLAVTRQEFGHVVVDAGSRFELFAKALFARGATIYLVTQVSISSLRNANRLITDTFTSHGIKPEIILNRYTPRVLGIDEASIAKALTTPAAWKIPNDYNTVQTAQNAATPVVLEDSPVSRVVRQMSRAACGLSLDTEKKKRFGRFR